MSCGVVKHPLILADYIAIILTMVMIIICTFFGQLGLKDPLFCWGLTIDKDDIMVINVNIHTPALHDDAILFELPINKI